VAARVVADSARRLHGPIAVVLTPAGLFLEAVPNRPLLFAPVGTPAEPEGGVVVLTLPDRVVTLRLLGVGYPERLAADAAGGPVLWDALNGEALWRLKRPEPVKAVAFGTWDDVLLIADGRGVPVYHTAELARRAKVPPE
jgi:hypothetical protein